MPRAAGQIDLTKNEAILDAAATVLSERGIAAPIERIAGVSKQTIYNHYGSKTELLRALIHRRAAAMVASLEPAADAEDLRERLTEFAAKLLRPSLSPEAVSVIRIVIMSGEDMADLAKQIYAAGPQMAAQKLAGFLEAADRDGLLSVPDAQEAGEFFAGMVIGHRELRRLLRMPPREGPEKIGAIAQAAADRFVRAYAP
jgi:TetR/AcrR family transcriptional regulator, mexJK operon transcriptional repressor